MGLEVIAVSGDEKLITAQALAESLDVSVKRGKDSPRSAGPDGV